LPERSIFTTDPDGNTLEFAAYDRSLLMECIDLPDREGSSSPSSIVRT